MQSLVYVRDPSFPGSRKICTVTDILLFDVFYIEIINVLIPFEFLTEFPFSLVEVTVARDY